ncbi:MAG: phosphopantothenate/pantothenate synthetase [Thaumarchaeota archaeon]|nr:phosphopantothenate/pantothenate synthetase [Nitrososphaerota archaeon]
MVVPVTHPRYESLRLRELLVEQYESGVVAVAGLIAHGRGEAFDYLLGETLIPPALLAIKAAAASIVLAKHPVISVNGNLAALAAREVAELSSNASMDVEVNLFYRSSERELATKRVLEKAGVRKVLGVGRDASERIAELGSERRRVDPRGIFSADLVLVPLEDGDRTEALRRIGKKVVAIDLNPLSRTSVFASISIVGNVVKVMPKLIEEVKNIKQMSREKAGDIINSFDNKKNLEECIRFIAHRLEQLRIGEASLPKHIGEAD